jgi:hypothetical protein
MARRLAQKVSTVGIHGPLRSFDEHIFFSIVAVE